MAQKRVQKLCEKVSDCGEALKKGLRDVLMESSGNGETRDRLKLVRMREDLHHDLCGFAGGHTIVHEIRRGEIHKVVVSKEN